MDAVASDAAAIVQLIQGGFEPRLLAGLVYGYPGIRFFVADQIGLGALSPYRYKVIRGPDGLLAAAEFRILEDALFLNYVAVVPDHFRKGLAMAVIADMRQEAAGQGLARFVLDVFTHNRIAINWYANKLKMAPGEVTTAWMASLPALDLPTPYRISDFPQAESVHQRLGFSEFTLAGGPSPLRIGRLGDRFFRLVQPGAASDPAVLSVLSRLDPARRLLVIAPGSHPAGPGWELLYSTQRFQVGIQEYIHA